MRSVVLATLCGLMLPLAGAVPTSWAAEGGRLVIIGGGLRPNNAAVYERLIEYAGGAAKARFAILPTAGRSQASAKTFRERLAQYGVAIDRSVVLDVSVANAERATADPAIIAQVQQSSGLFMTGGDQNRIVRALVKSDGSETPLLHEMRALLARGGVIAGSSAGAAAQSDPMIAVSGLPDDVLDEGLDALDFGLTTNPARRGLNVTRGLGFFRGGLIDQHFHQYRGRLSRLVRATTERKIRFGFGIDENTALAAEPNGAFEVIGPGFVTLVDTAGAVGEDGPLGCRIRNLDVSLLADGDRWDAATSTITSHSGRKEIHDGRQSNNGGFLIPDIAAEGAVPLAMISGLGDNSQRRQKAVTLKHYDTRAHGYRFTFEKTPATRACDGYVNGVFSHTVYHVRLEIEPIDGRLRPAASALPLDLPQGPGRTAVAALWFRGILPTDEGQQARPESAITRGEFARMLVRGVHLLPPRQNPPVVADVTSESDEADEVARVLSAGLMSVDDHQAFRSAVPLERLDAAVAFEKIAHQLHADARAANPVRIDDLNDVPDGRQPTVRAVVEGGWMPTIEGRFQPRAACTREQAALAMYRILGFPW